MNRNTIYYAAVVLTIVNLVALGTMAYNRWGRGSFESATREQRFEQMQRMLDLSSEQVAQLQTLRLALHAELDLLSARIVGERRGLARALRDEPFDSARVNRLVDSVSTLQSAAQRRMILHIRSVKTFLTPEQQEKFFEIVLERFSSSSDQSIPGHREQ